MKLARNSLYNLVGALVPIAVSLLTIPLFIREIGAERYGALAIAWVLLGYFGQADFGIGRATAQRISSMQGATRSEMATSVWSALISVNLFGLTGGILIFIAAHFYFAGALDVSEGIRGELLASVWALALCNPLVSLFGVLLGAMTGIEKFRIISTANLVSSSGVQLFPLVCALFISDHMTYLIVAALLARLLGVMIVGTGVWNAFLSGERPRWSAAEFRRLAGFGAWIMVTALIGPLLIFSDRILIGATIDAVAVAAYSVPFTVASRTLVIPLAVIQSLFPRFASEAEVESRARCRDYSVFVAQIFAPMMIGLICLAEPLLRLWIGSGLDPRSAAVGQILFAAFWVNALANVPFAFIQARGDPRYTAMLHVIELPIYLAMLFVLGSAWGLPGIAAAFGLRCTLDCVLLVRRAGIADRRMAMQLAGQVLLVAAALAVGLVVVPSWWTGLAIAALLGTASVLLLLLQLPETIRPHLAALPIVGRIVRARRA